MLDPFSRIAIVAVAVLGGAYALAYAPARARNASDVTVAFAPPTAGPTDDETPMTVPVARDPFAEPAPTSMPAPLAPAAHGELGLGMPHIGPLPGNLPGDLIPSIPGSVPDATVALAGGATGAARVTAVVTGAHPFAMVETGGVHELKGLGDRIAGSPVVAIDLDGIRLKNGVRLTVDPGMRP
jgi:hypothetical protein